MKWTSVLAIYFLIFCFSAFLTLPFGVKTSAEVGAEVMPGHAESAPHKFEIGKLAIRVTIVATILFSLFIANYRFGWVTPQMLDYTQWGR